MYYVQEKKRVDQRERERLEGVEGAPKLGWRGWIIELKGVGENTHPQHARPKIPSPLNAPGKGGISSLRMLSGLVVVKIK